MIMTLSTLRDELSNRLKATTTISTTQKDRWLNLAQEDIAQAADLPHLHTSETVTCVVDRDKYFLGFDYGRIISVTNRTAGIDLEYVTPGWVESVDPTRTSTGTATKFYFRGIEFVADQPAVAGTISVVSSSGSDTTQKVRIRGKSGGVERTELLTLNGLTPVVGTISWDVGGLHSVTKNGNTTGTITVTRGAVTVATLGPSQIGEERTPVYLWPIPASADTIVVQGYRKPKDMVDAEDSPDLPQLYHELVVVGAVIRGHRAMFRHTQADLLYESEWKPGLRALRAVLGKNRSGHSVVIMGQGNYPLAAIPYKEIIP